MVFSGAKAFVETRGMQVWSELCDQAPLDKWLEINEIANELPSIKGYANPGRYLKAVLLAIREDMKERPDAYDRAPFKVNEGMQFTHVML
jgi:hypothetical protein